MVAVRQGQQQGSVAARRLALLDKVEYRLAETDAEREAIYRLRYRAYLKEGAINSNSTGIVTDRYDDLPNSWIFGVFYEGALSSSLRITVGSPDYPACPSMDVFPDFLEPWLADGKVIVDPTRFVADPVNANRLPELPYLTLRLAYVSCEHFKADIGLASVRTEHQAFYRRVMMRLICASRPYPGLKKPISLMEIDFPAMHEKLFARYPFLRSTASERHSLFARSRHVPTLAFTEVPGVAPVVVADRYHL
ncbi:hypothetical protein DU475_12070 [Rhodopseudomonas sp. WA056]|uniref:N-acyl amino acid synthase FeeM domain-containing protein n=1 Tax=Rhodopseudomonas sp. WA056 TaxID=2269367 RepID=UPI0013E0D0EE|nr:hypothetical protein [Rhodopseudomonas sp. WA056]NEW87991.1 hypothetical protein [Rhodopseudomonas sp. WA056]